MTYRISTSALALAAMLALAACKPAAPASTEPVAPPPLPPMVEPAGCSVAPAAEGSAERTAILDAARPSVESMAGKPVEFVVTRLDVACDYARLIADPQAKSGGDHYETIDALLVRKDGKWSLGMMAAGEEDSPPAGEQYKAKYADAPEGLLN